MLQERTRRRVMMAATASLAPAAAACRLDRGSGSGAVLVSGNPDASKLWKALTHAEEPNMAADSEFTAAWSSARYHGYIIFVTYVCEQIDVPRFTKHLCRWHRH